MIRQLYFEGPHDRVEIPSSPLLDVPQDFALEAWVLVKRYTGGHAVLNRWSAGIGDIALTFGTPEPLTYQQLPSNDLVPSHVLATWAFVSFSNADPWITMVASTLPAVGEWHHLASSYGGGSLKLYVDGSQAARVNSIDRVANAPSAFFIGATARTNIRST